MAELKPSTLRAMPGWVLVHIPKRVEDTILIGGREMYFDGTFAEHFNKKLAGVVVGRPGRGSDDVLLTRRGVRPKRVPCSDIVDELAEGDVVYVDWTVLEAHFEVPGFGGVYRARLNQVVARVREGVLEPYGSYVLCKEVYPEGVEEVEVPGEARPLRLRVSASGLTLGTEEVPPLPWQGEVVLAGRPLRGQPQRLRAGDRVVFDKRYCSQDTKLPMRLKIEGAEYLCMRQDHIEAIVGPGGFRGYNYDPEGIGRLLAEDGRGGSLADVVEAHQRGSHGPLILRAIELGYITLN